ncbi:hypothetical protein CEXT_141991 [Caerostris extrusa]|uniref:Secreted protein n=1 Tax=Caerostris extrusa TaxID=172846 RepID=A0AAV4XBC9_CAEEX|nr:hypothetical protein CEXT_141991 [Caerostris extrusa]
MIFTEVPCVTLILLHICCYSMEGVESKSFVKQHDKPIGWNYFPSGLRRTGNYEPQDIILVVSLFQKLMWPNVGTSVVQPG